MMVKLGLGLAAAAGMLELPLVADYSGGTAVAPVAPVAPL